MTEFLTFLIIVALAYGAYYEWTNPNSTVNTRRREKLLKERKRKEQ